MAKLKIALVLLLLNIAVWSGSIVGKVTNAQSGKPISNVLISCAETNITAKSDSIGRYQINFPFSGSYSLLFSRSGFDVVTRNDIFMTEKTIKHVDMGLLPRIYRLDKIVVRSQIFRKSPDMAASTKMLNADEILRAPGALSDIQRVVQNLPSVSSGGDNVNEVVVRGGSPGENLMIMDGIELINANHFADQGSGGGVISIINPLLVKELTFNAGAPAARYGGKASSVIDVTLRDGNNEIVLGGVDLGIAGVGGHLEGPLWKGSNFIVSGHKSYMNIVTHFDPSLAVPQFWGIQGKLGQTIAKHHLSLNGIYGNSSIHIKQLEESLHYDAIKSSGITYAVGGNLRSDWADNFSTTFLVAGCGNSFDRLAYLPNTNFSPTDTDFWGGSIINEQQVKLWGNWNFRHDTQLDIGGFAKQIFFSVDQFEKPDTLRYYQNDSINGEVVLDSLGNEIVFAEDAKASMHGYKYGGWASSIIHIASGFRVVPGVRVDGFSTNSSLTFSPRLATILSLNDNLALTGAFGFQYQDPDYEKLVLHIKNISLEPKRATTVILGTEYEIPQHGMKFICEGFYKKYDNLLFPYALKSPQSINAVIPDERLGDPSRFYRSTRYVDEGEGHSFGIEFFGQKKLTKQLFGTVAVAFSRSRYLDLRPEHKGKWYDGDYDFRKSITITGGWKKELVNSVYYKTHIHNKWWFRVLSPIMPIADRMEISAKWRYLGGRPYTQKKFDTDYREWYIDSNEPLNNSRLEPYHRLDIRFERRYGFGFLNMIYYFDFQNIYSRENIWSYEYPEYESDKPEKSLGQVTIKQLPFFPAGGIIIGF